MSPRKRDYTKQQKNKSAKKEKQICRKTPGELESDGGKDAQHLVMDFAPEGDRA